MQRILAAPAPAQVVSADVADFRRELLQELDAIPFTTGFVDPMLYLLEQAEARFNATYGLTGPAAVQAAKLRRMMAERCAVN